VLVLVSRAIFTLSIDGLSLGSRCKHSFLGVAKVGMKIRLPLQNAPTFQKQNKYVHDTLEAAEGLAWRSRVAFVNLEGFTG
jgi:hypothetical protein